MTNGLYVTKAGHTLNLTDYVPCVPPKHLAHKGKFFAKKNSDGEKPVCPSLIFGVDEMDKSTCVHIVHTGQSGPRLTIDPASLTQVAAIFGVSLDVLFTWNAFVIESCCDVVRGCSCHRPDYFDYEVYLEITYQP